MDNRTKIIATLGPASDDRSVIEKMISAGMDMVRLNFSHGSYDHMKKLLGNVRAVAHEMGRHVGILQDLSGPKVRVGKLPDAGIPLKRGETVFLSTDTHIAKKDRSGNWVLPVNYKGLAHDVKDGDIILLDDGLIELRLEKKRTLECTVVAGDVLKSNKGINFPTASLSTPPLTAKDLKDLEFGLLHGVDFVALSFVKSADDIKLLRKHIEKHFGKHGGKNPRPWIVAKIERHEAIDKMEEIVAESDAIMVARGDLGIEVPPEHVPLIQKRLIKLCIDYGKPVITATQILHSMTKSKRATRAEISDAANAILDSTDALMLSNETAVGEYPIEAIRTLRKVASAVEADLRKHPHLIPSPDPSRSTTDATCLSAAHLASDIKAHLICPITKTGYTAIHIAKHRGMTPIYAFTETDHVARKLSLVWGVYGSSVMKVDFGSPFKTIRKTLLEAGAARKGDQIVICNSRQKPRVKLITTGRI